MNQPRRFFTGLFLIVAGSFLLVTGCKHLDRALLTQRVEPGIERGIIGTNTTLVTNVIGHWSLVTNLDGSITQQPKEEYIITPEKHYVYGDPVLVTNMVIRPEIDTGVQVIKAVPHPYALVAGTIIGWLLTGYRALRNKKIATDVIKSVEAARSQIRAAPNGEALDERFTSVLAGHQEASGVRKDVRMLRARHVSSSTIPAPVVEARNYAPASPEFKTEFKTTKITSKK